MREGAAAGPGLRACGADGARCIVRDHAAAQVVPRTSGPLIRARAVIAAGALAALGTARAGPAPDQPLVVAVEDQASPWSQPDGTGYANDVVRTAFAAAGVDVRFRVVPYARCKQLVVRGAEAACFSMSREPGIDSVVALADAPLFTCAVGFFERRAAPLGVARAAGLQRRTVVGVVLGYEYPESLRDLVRRGVLVFEPAPSEEINLRKLAAGRLDAALVNYDVVKTPDYVAASAGVRGRVRPAFDAGLLPSYIGFSRRHPRGAWALGRFNVGMRRIAADGRLRDIERRWVHAVTP